MHKWGNFGLYWCGWKTVGSAPTKKSFHGVANGRDGCTMVPFSRSKRKSRIKSMLRAHRPKSLKIAALLDKVSRRTEPIHGDYVGFEIPDEFVVGYGLDFAEHYRNLPDICVLESGPESG